jgi:hypothetical protein
LNRQKSRFIDWKASAAILVRKSAHAGKDDTMTELQDESVQTTVATPKRSNVGHVFLGVAALVAATAFGFSVLSAREAPNGLRGTETPATLATLEPRIAPAASQMNDAALGRFLGNGIWRAGACDGHGNFQAFKLSEAQVEVGAGHAGEGEKLQILRVRRNGDTVEVETRVCAPEPVGCNQTFEQYKVLGNDQLKEWHFEGRLPGMEPYVLVRDGRATDGTGEGRTFNRCTG